MARSSRHGRRAAPAARRQSRRSACLDRCVRQRGDTLVEVQTMLIKAQKYPFAPFRREEYANRLKRARRAMEAARLDALLITTEANFRYFSGLSSQGWVSPTRPMFLVLSLRHDPIAV